MTLPLIRMAVREGERHGAGVLKIAGSNYVDVHDVAHALDIDVKIVCAALKQLQDRRKAEIFRVSTEIKEHLDD